MFEVIEKIITDTKAKRARHDYYGMILNAEAILEYLPAILNYEVDQEHQYRLVEITRTKRNTILKEEQKYVAQYHCLRCLHKWIPRIWGVPKLCAKCKSPYWNVSRRKDIKNNPTNEK